MKAARVWLTGFTKWPYGCAHRQLTFPMTVQAKTYVVCLDCGRHFGYDWSRMCMAGQGSGRMWDAFHGKPLIPEPVGLISR